MTRQVKDRKTKAGAEKLAKEIKGQHTFDVDHFLDSPAFSTAEFKIGEEKILVVEPL